MRQWFNNLERQEQLMLMLLAAVLVVYVFVAFLWRPMSQSVSDLQLSNERSSESLAKVNVLADEYQALVKTGANSGSKQNLTRLIDSTVKQNQLSMSRFQPSSSGDVQVRFENAVYDNIIAWLHALETAHSVRVKDLSITMGSQSGIVNVSVRLRKDG